MYELQKIEIGGRLRPIKFGTNQTAILCDLRNYSLKELHEVYGVDQWRENKIGAKDIRDLLYSGLRAGAISQGEEVDFNEIVVGDWMDEVEQAEVSRAMKLYVESLIPKALRVKVQEYQENHKTEQ